MGDLPQFQHQQYALTAHLRDPQSHPAPEDLEDRRVRVYRELLINNLTSLLGSTFPVLRRIYREGTAGEAGWRRLVRRYFAGHRARTPLFPEVPGEFVEWLRDAYEPGPEDPPFLTELAHYEWVELALSIAEEELDDVEVHAEGDLLDGCPVLSPLAWPLAYAYPVHRLSPTFTPAAPGGTPTFLVVYRDRADRVGFLEINPVTARLLDAMSRSPQATGRELLTNIAEELRYPDPRAVIDSGAGILASLRERDIVLGAR